MICRTEIRRLQQKLNQVQQIIPAAGTELEEGPDHTGAEPMLTAGKTG